MTPDQFRAMRKRLELSAARTAQVVRVSDGRTVRRWETGERDIPGPVMVVFDLIENIPEVRQYLGLALPGDTAPQAEKPS